jgi:hypothetical protein
MPAGQPVGGDGSGCALLTPAKRGTERSDARGPCLLAQRVGRPWARVAERAQPRDVRTMRRTTGTVAS